MAGSRLEKFGTIFTRVTGLLRSGAIRDNSKPLWYEVYEAFPPKIEPNMFRPVPNVPVIDILYPEDYIRARFYDTFGSPGLIDMTNQVSKFKNLSQIFIDKYLEIATNSDNTLTDDQLFKATEEALISQGFKFQSDEIKVSNVQSIDRKEKSNVKSSTVTQIAFSDY